MRMAGEALSNASDELLIAGPLEALRGLAGEATRRLGNEARYWQKKLPAPVRILQNSGANPVGLMLKNPADKKKVVDHMRTNANDYPLTENLFGRYVSGAGAQGLQVGREDGQKILDGIRRSQEQIRQGQIPDAGGPAAKQYYPRKIKEGYIPVGMSNSAAAGTMNSLGRYYAKPQPDGSYVINDEYDFSYRNRPSPLGASPVVTSPGGLAHELVTSGAGRAYPVKLRVLPDGTTQALP
jgi:hypothetical protein